MSIFSKTAKLEGSLYDASLVEDRQYIYSIGISIRLRDHYDVPLAEIRLSYLGARQLVADLGISSLLPPIGQEQTAPPKKDVIRFLENLVQYLEHKRPNIGMYI